MPEHRLSREIISTQLANEIVNRMGPAFIPRLVEESGKDVNTAAKAYLIARDIFDMQDVWQRIEKLDTKISSTEQYKMYVNSSNLIKHGARWLIEHINSRSDIAKFVSLYSEGAKKIYKQLPRNLGKDFQYAYKLLRTHYSDIGIKDRHAKRIASTAFMYSALDIISVAEKTKAEVSATTQTYAKLGQVLNLDWLHNEIVRLKVSGQWQAMARNSLRDQAYKLHRDLTHKVISDKKAQGDVSIWLNKKSVKRAHLSNMLASIKELSKRDFSTLSVLVQELKQLL